MIELVISLLEDMLFSVAKKQKMTTEQKNSYKKFLKELQDWGNDFISQNEHTIISSSGFSNYINNYNLIKKIISFVRSPQNQNENKFIEACQNEAIEYLSEKRTLENDDFSAVKEFISVIFKKVYDYYQSQVSEKDAIFNYEIVQLNVKVNEFGSAVEDIKGIICPQKPVIARKSFQMPENTIIRKVAPYKKIQESYFFASNEKDFLETCITEKHIVLLGEAGCGKSIALKQLSAAASDTEYYTLQYNLNNYTDSSIEEIVFSEYPKINLEKVFLIFDGYDEIEETNLNKFARKLVEFVIKTPNTIVVISSRNNFYKFADDDGTGGLFDNFKEYGVAPITSRDIKKYIEEDDINFNKFWGEVCDRELNNIIYTPFYLCEIKNIYKDKGCLPQKSTLMEDIIVNRFNKDCGKYSRTKNLENYEEEIFTHVENLAFSIQCLKTTKISNIDYQKLFDKNQRDIISYSGIFSKNSKKEWSFEHNNFREYLTAKFINKLSISELKKLLFNKNGKIRNSWVNVLSFLVLIRENGDLLSLLTAEDPEMIIRFERNRLDEQTRNNIAIKILDNFSEKSMWLSHGRNSSDAIAKFGQSKKLCEYLIEQIENPPNFKTQSNALSVLEECSELYGMDNKVRTALFECLKCEKTRTYEKCKAIETIVALKLDNDEITQYIVSIFNKENLPDYRLSVFRYLNATNAFEDYIDLYIEEYKSSEKHLDQRWSIRNEVLAVFAKCVRCDSLCKILSVISEYSDDYSDDTEIYKKIASNILKAYMEEKEKIYKCIINSFIVADTYNRNLTKILISFFDKTGTRTNAFMKMLEIDLHVKSYKTILPMETLGDDICYEFLLEEYKNNPEKYLDVVKVFASRFDEDNPWLKKYREALISNGVNLPGIRRNCDFQKARQSGEQYLFDSLFDKDSYCVLVQKLVMEVGNKNVTFAELKDMDYDPVRYDNSENKKEEFALLELYYSLIRCKDGNNIVIDTISNVSNWNDFIISEVYHLLSRNDCIVVNNQQKRVLKDYCDEQLKNMNLQDEFTCNGSNIIYSYRLLFLIFFSNHFNFDYSSNVYDEMLMLPPFLFNKTSGNNYGRIPKYLTEKYTQTELKEQIIKNLQIDTLCEDVLIMYILYCKDNNFDYAMAAAEKMCLTDSSSYHKQIAVDYLIEIKNYEYIYEKFLDTEDMELLDVIVEITIKYKDDRLKNKLEEINKKSQEGNLYISKLISLNSRYALERYLQICKGNMNSYGISNNSYADSVFEAISSISDANLLDVIGELRILLFTDGFNDLDSFGLWNSLYNAYKNLAIVNYEAVKKQLTDASEKTSICDREKGFCNTLLNDIENANSEKSDVAWSIDDIKEFLLANQ